MSDGPTGIEKVQGGEIVNVKMAQNPDVVEPVLVRQIAVKDFKIASELIGDEAKLAGFATTRGELWVLGLTPESYTAVLEAVDRQNQDFFAFVTRTVRRASGVMTEQILNKVLQSPPSSRKSVLPAG